MNFDQAFSLTSEKPVEEQVRDLSEEHRKAFDSLRQRWFNKPRKFEFNDHMILRFLRASPGKTKFNTKTAYSAMKNYASWGVELGLKDLDIFKVEEQLRSGCLIIPNCLDPEGNEYLYMKPGLYFPGKDDLNELLRSLVYLLGAMTEKEKNATNGIAFMANMEGWGWSNFSIKYASNFFKTMQGRYPCRVRRFLIVNPPGWFSAVWRMIRPMMSRDFASKVSMPTTEEMAQHVAGGMDSIPIPLGGNLDLDEALEEFIRQRIEDGK